MSKWIVAFIAIVVLAGAGFGGYRIYQYRQWKVAYGSALDAFKRAYDYRDAGTLLYDPRPQGLRRQQRTRWSGCPL